MNVSIKWILLGFLALLIIFFIIDVARIYMLAKKGKILADSAVPFERVLPNASMKILVLGDSTAYGTGAESPEVSTAGRLGALYREASVTNLAHNGLKLAGLLKILDLRDSKEHFGIILVQIGANDIIQLTSMKDIEHDADEVFARLSKQTGKLIVLHSGDVGDARLFPIYVRPILTRRSYEVREIYTKLALKYGFRYVDLIGASTAQLFKTNPDTYYAGDNLHLNGAGYGLWFDEIKKSL